jgi:ADP-ribose pyrophosphatase YjhB (NUDIX family)
LIKVAGTLLVQNGQYVFQHRDDKPGIAEPGTYSLWGGMLEEGESVVEGALRELKEETGISAEAADLIPLTDLISIGEGPRSKGKKVHGYLFALNIGRDIKVEINEGQRIVRLPITKNFEHPKLNWYAFSAIKHYEKLLA